MRKSIGSGRKQPIKCRGTSLLPRCHSNMTRLMLSSGVFCLFDLMFGFFVMLVLYLYLFLSNISIVNPLPYPYSHLACSAHRYQS